MAGGPESLGVVESGAAVTRTRRVNRQGLAIRWAVSMMVLFGVALAVFVALAALAPVLPELLVGPRAIVAATLVVSGSVMFWLVPGVAGGGARRRFPKALEL